MEALSPCAIVTLATCLSVAGAMHAQVSVTLLRIKQIPTQQDKVGPSGCLLSDFSAEIAQRPVVHMSCIAQNA